VSGTPTTYVAVNLDALRHNVAQVLAHLAEGSRLCAVVKANAYGHGAILAAQACVEAGAEWLGVSEVGQGVALREAGIDVPILAFMPPLEDEFEALVTHDLTATLTSEEQVMQLQREAERQGKVGLGHIYEDLGLGRIGPSDGIMDILQVAEPWPQVQITGVYSHFGPPGSGMELDVVEWLGDGAGLKLYSNGLREAAARVTDRRLLLHFAASMLFLERPDNHLDMVRIGTLLYGQYPDHTPEAQRTLDLQSTFELRSHIVAAHTVPRGKKIGYGGEFVCARETRVATVPVGLAHGLGVVPESTARSPRSFVKGLVRARISRKGKTDRLPYARIGDQRAPIIGRISMDQCSLDVTDVPEAQRGAEVVLPVRRVTTNPTIPRIPRDF